jgi:hypothetical protein
MWIKMKIRQEFGAENILRGAFTRFFLLGKSNAEELLPIKYENIEFLSRF